MNSHEAGQCNHEGLIETHSGVLSRLIRAGASYFRLVQVCVHAPQENFMIFDLLRSFLV